MNAELTLAIRQILSEPKILNISYSTDVPAAKGYASAKISTELVDAATTRIMDAVQQEIAKATKDPFDYIQPCDPDCSPERHAYHKGQWDMAHRMADKGLTLKEHKEKL